jgi:hypothetical protein
MCASSRTPVGEGFIVSVKGRIVVDDEAAAAVLRPKLAVDEFGVLHAQDEVETAELRDEDRYVVVAELWRDLDDLVFPDDPPQCRQTRAQPGRGVVHRRNRLQE